MSLLLKRFVTKSMGENIYLLFDSESGDVAVIDPGEYLSALQNELQNLGIKELKYILLTHGHFDHIGGVKKLKEKFGGKVAVHSLDSENLFTKAKNLARFFGLNIDDSKADIILSDGDKLPFGNGNIEVIYTPGHTKGGVCYKINDMLFTGDTLFNLSAGRTDFPGGSYKELSESLRKLSSLEGDYKVYPGHEEETTLEFERRYNSFMKGN